MAGDAESHHEVKQGGLDEGDDSHQHEEDADNVEDLEGSSAAVYVTVFDSSVYCLVCRFIDTVHGFD